MPPQLLLLIPPTQVARRMSGQANPSACSGQFRSTIGSVILDNSDLEKFDEITEVIAAAEVADNIEQEAGSSDDAERTEQETAELLSSKSWGADLSFRELDAQYKDGDLVKPEIQRRYVWNRVEASKFIDSILLGLPIPSIFLAKAPDDKLLIVDGYQRIMTVHDYMRGKMTDTDTPFSLLNSKQITKQWRGKSFSQLPDEQQRRIKNTTIHCIIFATTSSTTADKAMYEIFERINTSGRSLVPQEIRNCIYQGSYNKSLISLNEFPAWRKLFGVEQVDARMRDTEFILRFFAFRNIDFRELEEKQVSLKALLNSEMSKNRELDADARAAHERQFKSVIEFVLLRFGEFAFQNYSDSLAGPSGKFSPPLFDALCASVDRALSQRIAIPDNLSERLEPLLKDQSFRDLLRIRTTNADRVVDRIERTYATLFVSQ